MIGGGCCHILKFIIINIIITIATAIIVVVVITRLLREVIWIDLITINVIVPLVGAHIHFIATCVIVIVAIATNVIGYINHASAVNCYVIAVIVMLIIDVFQYSTHIVIAIGIGSVNATTFRMLQIIRLLYLIGYGSIIIVIATCIVLLSTILLLLLLLLL